MKVLKRLMVAVIGIPILMFIFLQGGYFLAAFLMAVGVANSIEMKNMISNKGINPNFMLIPFAALIFYFTAYHNVTWIFTILFVFIVVMMSFDLFTNKLENAFNRIAASIFIIVYGVMSIAVSFRITNLQYGNKLLLFLLILIWLTDSAAYTFGMLLGRVRNIFKASPKKSITGFIAGFIFSFLGAFIISKLFPEIPSKQLYLAAVAASSFGQIGDLFESVLKRDCQIKDSSNFLPGHGGVLDRFDSYIIAAPSFLILLKFFT